MGLGPVDNQDAVLAPPILSVASFEWRSRATPFKPLKVTSTGKMGDVPEGICQNWPIFTGIRRRICQHVLPPHTRKSEPILTNQLRILIVNRP